MNGLLKKLLVAVFAIGVLLFGGWFFLRNGLISNVLIDNFGAVAITNLEEEYNQGKTVTATLSYKTPICSILDGGDWSASWSVQKWENNSWVDFRKSGKNCDKVDLNKINECPPIIALEPPFWKKVEGVPKFNWDQKYSTSEKSYKCRNLINRIETAKCSVFGQAPPGRYKLRFGYNPSLAKSGTPFAGFEHYVEKGFQIK